MKRRLNILVFVVIFLVISLACNATAKSTAQPDANLVNTQAAMGMTQTALAKPVTGPTDAPKPPASDPGLVNTQVAMAITQTALSNPPAATKPPATLAPTKAPTAMDIHSMIESANILVFEEIAGDPLYIAYVARALKTIGGHQVYVGDAIGTLMDQLNSGTDWDLIIIAAESRGSISGDYWDAIKRQVDKGAGLIAEVWYIDDTGGGKIAPLLYECGVELEKDWYRVPGSDRLSFDINWDVPDSPVFNTPNRVARFAASLTEPAWMGDIGDLMRTTPGSDAIILGSHSSGGLITSCMDGRMILQTFDSHDYPTDPMVALWQNYIYYTLTNHFKAQQ